MSRKMTDNDLNELTHEVADAIDHAAKIKVDRYRINDMLEALLNEAGIEVVEDAPQRKRSR